jgi:hypothetical protein
MNHYTSDLQSRLVVSMTRGEASELLAMMNRALNTLEPKDWPSWMDGLLNRLEQFSHAKTVVETIYHKNV